MATHLLNHESSTPGWVLFSPDCVSQCKDTSSFFFPTRGSVVVWMNLPLAKKHLRPLWSTVGFIPAIPEHRMQLFRTGLRRRSIPILKNVHPMSKVWRYQVEKRHLTCLVIVLVYLCPAGLRRAWHLQVPPANQIRLNADTKWNAYLWVIVRGSLRKPDFTKLYDSVDQTQNATVRHSGIREERNVQFST